MDALIVYVVRHGQTDWNAESRFQGQKDIPLNELGRAQAAGNGMALSRIIRQQATDFDFVSSPLGRTRHTMELLRAAMGLDPKDYRTDDRLKEVCFGDWEGLTIAELQSHYPDRVAARAGGKWDFIPPGDHAESYEILSWRVGAWLNSIDRPTVCVSHGGVIRSIFRLVADTEKDEACQMHVPQDQVLKVDLHARRVDWL